MVASHNIPAQGFDKDYYSSDTYAEYLEKCYEEGQADAARLLQVVKPEKNWQFLDIGCGLGGWMYGIQKAGFTVQGTEVSDFCLEHSRMKEFMIKTDVRKLPFADKSFDVSLSFDVVYYLEPKEQEKAIAEMVRVTKQFVYFSTITRESKNADPVYNPDKYRNNEYLLSYEDNLRLLEKYGLQFVQPLFPESTNGDFEGVFRVLD